MLIEVLQYGVGARSLFNQPQTGGMRSRPQCIYCIYVYVMTQIEIGKDFKLCRHRLEF